MGDVLAPPMNVSSHLIAPASMVSQNFHHFSQAPPRPPPPTTSLCPRFPESLQPLYLYKQNLEGSSKSASRSPVWRQKNNLPAAPHISFWRCVYLHKTQDIQNNSLTLDLSSVVSNVDYALLSDKTYVPWRKSHHAALALPQLLMWPYE